MNLDIVGGNWNKLKGKVQVRWSTLIGDHLGVITGRQTQLAGERQRAYGVLRSKTLRSALGARYRARSTAPNRTAVDNLPPRASVLTVRKSEKL